MIALLTAGIAPLGADKKIRPSCREINIGGEKTLWASLGLPLSMTAKHYDRAAFKLLDRMKDMGADELAAPGYYDEMAAMAGLRRADDLRVLRRRASEAAQDLLNGRRSVCVTVYSRAPSREAESCLFDLAPVCRWITAEGGDWAKEAKKRLLWEYGAAAPSDGWGGARIAAVFDKGFAYRGEEAVIDLTREGLDCPKRVRPRLIYTGEKTIDLPLGAEKSRFLASVYSRGGLKEDEIRAVCPVFS